MSKEPFTLKDFHYELIQTVKDLLTKESIVGEFNITVTSLNLYGWLGGYRYSVSGLYQGHAITAEAEMPITLALIILDRIKRKVSIDKFNGVTANTNENK